MDRFARLPAERRGIYARLQQEIDETLVLQEVTTRKLSQVGSTSWVWDATVLPTSSHYVPVFLRLLAEMESAGEVEPNSHILVETTTGNAGAAIAYLARELGYPVLIFMPGDMPPRRLDDVRSFLPDDGISELRLTPEGAYVRGVVAELRRFLITYRDTTFHGRELCVVNHSRREGSVLAIEECVSSLLQSSAQKNTIDTAVVALGNGTTATGVARAVRQLNPEARVVGVEPVEAPWFFVQKYGEEQLRSRHSIEPGFHPHRLIGTGGWGVRFPLLDLNVLDDVVLVSEAEWQGKLEQLQQSGFTVGHTSAACQSVIERLATQGEANQGNYFAMFYDPIWKYAESPARVGR